MVHDQRRPRRNEHRESLGGWGHRSRWWTSAWTSPSSDRNVYSLNGNNYYGFAVQAQYIADAAIHAGTKIVVTFTMPDGSYAMGQLFASPYPGFIVPHDVDPPVNCLPELDGGVLRRVVCTDDITETVPAGSTIGHNYTCSIPSRDRSTLR